jgi:hypothetical protein
VELMTYGLHAHTHDVCRCYGLNGNMMMMTACVALQQLR